MGILKRKFILYTFNLQDQSCNKKIRTIFTTCAESISSCLGIYIRFIHGKLKFSSRTIWETKLNLTFTVNIILNRSKIYRYFVALRRTGQRHCSDAISSCNVSRVLQSISQLGQRGGTATQLLCQYSGYNNSYKYQFDMHCSFESGNNV